jgi:hypothetical protein
MSNVGEEVMKRDFFKQTKVGTEMKEIISVKNAVGFKVRLANLELFSSATFYIDKIDENDRTLQTTMMRLEGDDYLNWGGDDNYVMSYAAEMIGMAPSREWIDEQKKKLEDQAEEAQPKQPAEKA